MGVAALLEAADLVVGGRARQDRAGRIAGKLSGWCRGAEAGINWHNHIDLTYNLIRGCNPVPGAWTTHDGRKLFVFDARKHPARTLGQSKGAIGSVVHIGDHGVLVAVQGGQVELIRLRLESGKKLPAPQVCADAGIAVGTHLGGG